MAVRTERLSDRVKLGHPPQGTTAGSLVMSHRRDSACMFGLGSMNTSRRRTFDLNLWLLDPAGTLAICKMLCPPIDQYRESRVRYFCVALRIRGRRAGRPQKRHEEKTPAGAHNNVMARPAFVGKRQSQ